MAYIIRQKIKDRIYLYEVESYWNPEKKQPRQRRKYLGKEDPQTGEAIAPRKGFRPRAARNYGNAYLLRQVAESSGLRSVLAETFGADAELLLQLACFQVSESRPLYLFRSWQEGNQTPLTEEYSSQRLSRFVTRLGGMDRERETFFGRWIARQGAPRAVVFDITSLSSYAKLVDLVEWGYNRDGEGLPQVNLGMAFGQPANLPLAYRVWPGSVADVSTLATTTTFLREYGLRELSYVLDRGFYSLANVVRMAAEGVRFVVPVPFSSKWAMALVAKNRKGLTSAVNGFCFQKQSLSHVKAQVEVGGKTVWAHMYFDRKRQAEEEANFIRRLVEIETQVATHRFKGRKAASIYLNRLWKGANRLFSVSLQDGRVELRRKPKALSRLVNRMGYTLMLSNEETLGRDEVLLVYRRRDAVEKLFDIMKNELRENRLRVHSRTAVEGRLFLCYLAMILYSSLDNAMREQQLYKHYTVAEVLAELKTLRSVEMTSGKSYLTEMTKRQRTLLEKLKVPPPPVT
ncbi:MAG: IS1634 family transposase [Acidobacteria bacterium]|nr:IS1634 family transposase [Acidobacteriota bacterium]